MTREEKAKLEIIGDNLRFQRKRAGLTQTKVHNELGITQNTVCNYERGQRSPSTLRLLRLAKMYGCSVKDFLEGV